MNALIIPRSSLPLKESRDRYTSQTLRFIIFVDARCVLCEMSEFLATRGGKKRR